MGSLSGLTRPSPAAMAALNGKWKLVAVDNFELYLDAVGVDAEARQKALQFLTPANNIQQDIEVAGDAITITTITPIAPTTVTATSGASFASLYLDGREIKTVFTVEGDTLVEEISGPFSTRIVRARDGDCMVMTMTSGDVTSTRRYEKV